jgi:hypothetical protein
MLVVLGLIAYVQWPTSKASVATENLSSALNKLAGATLVVKRGDSSTGYGKVTIVGEDFIQTSSGTYYPFSAIVTDRGSNTTLTIEVR